MGFDANFHMPASSGKSKRAPPPRDIQEISAGGGGNRKLPVEINRDRSLIRCAQGHSAGGVVRADCLPAETDINYLIHGTRLESAQLIVRDGLSRRQWLHVHFYECDRDGNLLHGESVRRGADDGIAVSPSQ